MFCNARKRSNESENIGFRREYGIGLYVPDRLIAELEKERETDSAASVMTNKQEPIVAPKRKAISRKPRAKQSAKSVQIFDVEKLDKLIAERKQEDNERTKRQLPDLEAARSSEGVRRLFTKTLANILEGLRDIKADMPNFAEAIDIMTGELALAFAGKPEDFRVSAICMNGVPGIGKTRFAREVARVLKVGFDTIALGSSGGGFELSGVSAGYGNSKSGRLFRLLAEGESACPVVLLDEIDKMAGDERFPTLPPLLDLLEADSAKRFRDEGVETRFDASKIIFLATSNEAELIPGPLQSRIRMVEIQPPTVQQRREITGRIASEFTAFGVLFQTSVLDDLAEVDMDLRALRRFLREIAGRALSVGLTEIGRQDITIPTTPENKKMGFV